MAKKKYIRFNKAIRVDKNTGIRSEELVNAADLTRDDKKDSEFYCVCGSEAILVINPKINNCFRSLKHKEGCEIVKARGKNKTETVDDGYKYNPDQFTDPKEPTTKPPVVHPPGVGPKIVDPDPEDQDDYNLVIKHRILKLRNLKRILEEYSKGNDIINANNPNDSINNYIIDCDKIQEIKDEQPDEFVGIILLRKCLPYGLGLPNINNRIWLKDINSPGDYDDSAIYCSLCVLGDEYNNRFQKIVKAKDKLTKIEKLNIYVYAFARFVKVPNAKYLTYEAELDRSGYVFLHEVPEVGDIVNVN